MKMTLIVAWLSLAVVGSVLVFIVVTDHEQQVLKSIIHSTKPDRGMNLRAISIPECRTSITTRCDQGIFMMLLRRN